jgi:hypothetical protein
MHIFDLASIKDIATLNIHQLTMAPSRTPLLAPANGSVMHFVLTTTPLLAVLIYFLYEAWQRPSTPLYQLDDDFTNDEWEAAAEETGELISLMDILTVFLSLHVFWTIFAVYVISFIAKRRHLIGRYFSEGESSVGDVMYDKSSRMCGGFHDYGYVVYAHPTQKKLIRKRVRVYQPYTREKITILRLPNRPLSGQARIDLEIDLNAASKERDTHNKSIAICAICWVVFTLLGPIYVLYQMTRIHDDQEDPSLGIKVYLVVVGLNIPFSYAVNWIRFLLYRNWIVNRGAVVEDNGDARKVQGCLKQAHSEDGSDVIPYSILNEDNMSYQGTIPSHRSLQASLASKRSFEGSLRDNPQQQLNVAPADEGTKREWVSL